MCIFILISALDSVFAYQSKCIFGCSSVHHWTYLIISQCVVCKSLFIQLPCKHQEWLELTIFVTFTKILAVVNIESWLNVGHHQLKFNFFINVSMISAFLEPHFSILLWKGFHSHFKCCIKNYLSLSLEVALFSCLLKSFILNRINLTGLT